MADVTKYIMTAGAIAALVVAGPASAQTTTQTTAQTTTQPSGQQALTTTSVKTVTTVTKAQTPDPDMQQLLSALTSLKPKPIEALSVKEARKQPTLADAVKVLVESRGGKLPSNDDIEHDDSSYTTKNGQKQDVDIYYTKTESKALRPVIVYFHGGGWVLADNDVYKSSIVALARKTGAVVIAAEYRQAPENRFPAAHEDAVAAYKWAVSHAKDYNGDNTKIAVVGESAGGNLAANVAIAARDQNLQRPVALGLIYPVAGTDMSTPSYVDNQYAKPLNRAMMAWFMKQIVRPENRASAMRDPRLNLVAADLKDLPPTTVITAGIDPLKSEGELLSERLQAAGVGVNYRNYDGVTHEFFGADAVLGDAVEAQDYLSGRLTAAFKR